MKMRHISNAFGKKLLEKGTIIDKVSKQSDNGFVEMISVVWTNGVEFIVVKVDGNIVEVHGV